MRLCLFGTFTVAPGYPVNRVLLQGLERAGHQVTVRRADAWGPVLHRALATRNPLRLALLGMRLIRAWVRLWWACRQEVAADWIVVGYPGFFDVHLARWLFGRRPVALVSFISLYDTVAMDRAQVSARSLSARWLYWLDRAAFAAADVVLADTEQLCAYYAERFDLPAQTFARSFVGEEDEPYRYQPAPARAPGETLRVLFFGTYVPLHGVDTIVAAAEALVGDAAIELTLVGRGPGYDELRLRAAAAGAPVRFVPEWQTAEQLAARIADSHVCLGVFGTTPKAARVIPYKVFDAAAVGRPVVTRDSPAIRELFTDGDSALLCPAGDAAALAAALRRLRDDDALRLALGRQAYDVYRRHGAPEAVGAALADTLAAREPGR